MTLKLRPMCVDLSILSALILDQMSRKCTGSLLYQASSISPPALCMGPYPGKSSKRGHDASAPAAASSCCPGPSAADGVTDDPARQPKRRAVQQQQGGGCELQRAPTTCSERLSSQPALESRPGTLQASAGSAFQPYMGLSGRSPDAQLVLPAGQVSSAMLKVHSTPSSSGWNPRCKYAGDLARTGGHSAPAAPDRHDALPREQVLPESSSVHALQPSVSPDQSSRQTIRPLAAAAVHGVELRAQNIDGLRLPMPLGLALPAAGQTSGHSCN